MSYKTPKYNQFSVAYSMEKIAIEKGLYKPEKTFKSVAAAAQEINALVPTADLDENIIKLCDGLRAKGFNKYADDVESKFVQYKKANALYDVSKETGADVVNSAHPEGSHTMENMEGDCTIETILERQKKIQNAILKHPTGKLASSKDIANIARIILAQSQSPKQLKQTVHDNLKQFIKTYLTIKTFADADLLIKLPEASKFDDTFANPTYNNIKNIKDYIVDKALKDMEPSLGEFIGTFQPGKVKQHTWEMISRGISACDQYLQDAMAAQLEIEQGQQASMEPKEEAGTTQAQGDNTLFTNAEQAIKTELDILQSWKSVEAEYEDPKEKQFVTDSITKWEEKLNELLGHVSKKDVDANTLKTTILSQLQTVEKEMSEFYDKWVK